MHPLLGIGRLRLGHRRIKYGLWATVPTVLLIDEIDSLIGDTLVSVLRQLRGGYTARPKNFPQSVILCGLRDIRDYRIHASSEKDVVTGGSCFNVNAESLNVVNLSAAEVQALYQHCSAAILLRGNTAPRQYCSAASAVAHRQIGVTCKTS